MMKESIIRKPKNDHVPFSSPKTDEGSENGVAMSPPSLQLKAESKEDDSLDASATSSFQGSKEGSNESVQMKEKPFQLEEKSSINAQENIQLDEDEGEEIVATEEKENEKEQEPARSEDQDDESVEKEGQSDQEKDVVGETSESDSEQQSSDIEQELQMKLKPGSHGSGCGCSNCSAQMKVSQQKPKEENSSASASVGSKTKLPETVQNKMESSMGADFSSVNIYPASENASEIGAKAYTQGSDVHFAKGEYSPESNKGQELIGHELTHVVQQDQGRVNPTTQRKGMPVNDNPGLESEADIEGRKAANHKQSSEQSKQPIKQNSGQKSAPVQGIFGKIWKGVKKVASKVGSGIKKVGSAIGNGIKKVGGKIWDGAKWVVGGLKKAAGKIWDGANWVLDAAGKVAKNIWDGRKWVAGKVKDGLDRIWDGTKWIAGKVWRATKKVWNGVKWIASKVWDKLKAIYHRVIFFVKSWPKRLQRWAMLIWDGVKSLKPWSIEWWKSLGKASTWKKFGFYLFELILQSAEVLGVTDIYETAIDFLKFNTRGLTGRERSIAQGIFGNSIEYDMVRLDLWAVLGPSWSGREYVSMHTINGWGGKIEDDVLIHELTHVWQYERTGAAYISGALHAQVEQGQAAYSYGGVDALKANAGIGLSAYNPEAQGNIIQHYYRLQNGFDVDGAAITDLPTYQTYVDELRR